MYRIESNIDKISECIRTGVRYRCKSSKHFFIIDFIVLHHLTLLIFSINIYIILNRRSTFSFMLWLVMAM